MKTPEFARDLRRFTLAGVVPPWANEQFCQINLHTEKPTSPNHAVPNYAAYSAVKMLRSDWKDVGGESVNSKPVKFPKYINTVDNREILVTHVSVTIGRTLAYIDELPEPVSLRSGNIPSFDENELAIAEV